MSPVARCRSCNAPVLWRTHVETGRDAPINAEPVPEGNILLVGETRYRLVTRLDDDPAAPHHTSHWATCPDRQRWKAQYAGRRLRRG